jgi:Gpi18-like mannosyltransferase
MAKSKITFIKIAVFAFLILIGFGVRIIPVNNLINDDILVHLDWSKTIYKRSLNDIYFYPKWMYAPPSQPPLMMLGFWTSRHLYENRYLLSELHNFIKLPPSSLIIWFDKYGEFLLLRLWAILGDFLSAFLIFYILKKHFKNYKIALLGFVYMLFNPLSIFETTIWGQNDIISIFFAYLAFINIDKKKISIFSPIFFLISILIKPTSLVFIPFYIYYFLKNCSFDKKNIFKTILSLFFCLAIIYFSFKPFLVPGRETIKEIYTIVSNRIITSSKGLSRASNSGFNLYSLVFEIDKTYGNTQVLGIKLDSLGLIFYLLINVVGFYIVSKKSKLNTFRKLIFILFFIGQGTFLFMTGMLERYFFPAFLASIILMFIEFKQVGVYMIAQNIFWLLNLFYSFYQRDVSWIKILFEGNSNLLIRIISLISLLNYFLIFRKFIALSKKYSATSNQD